MAPLTDDPEVIAQFVEILASGFCLTGEIMMLIAQLGENHVILIVCIHKRQA